MNSITPNLNVETDSDRFLSLDSLRQVHSELLKRHREEKDNPELVKDIQQFIRQGKATGVVLDDDSDRWGAQSLLDYWNTLLYRTGEDIPDATLDDFDLSLAPSLPDKPCPYLALAAFREKDKELFYGREWLLENLLKHLETNQILLISGSSGSGKSSVVLGGLIPRLNSGALPESEHWHCYKPVVPGADPLRSLARAISPDRDPEQEISAYRDNNEHLVQLVEPADQQPVVLVIDQFEEIFTLCLDNEIRADFVNNLLKFAQFPKIKHRLILTMRTDFEDRLSSLPNYNQELFERICIRVSPLDAKELRQAIEKPAERVGLKIDPRVVNALITDVLGEPAALPLLQFTLLKLWEQRDHNRVTWESYDHLGGGRNALAESADKFYNDLIPEDQDTCQRILLKMVTVRRSTDELAGNKPISLNEGLEVTSNRTSLEDINRLGLASDRVERVLNKLVEAYLIRRTEADTSDIIQYEVAHEALIRNWPRLQEWLDRDREKIRQRQRLTETARRWESKEKDGSILLRGLQLKEAQEYKDLNPLEEEFLKASVDEEDRLIQEQEEKKQQERDKKSLQQRSQLLLAGVLLFAGITIYALQQKKEADIQKGIAVEAAQKAEDAQIDAVKQKGIAVKAAKRTIDAQQKEIVATKKTLKEAQKATAARQLLKEITKINQKITTQNQEITTQNQKITTQNQEITRQKKIAEKQTKTATDARKEADKQKGIAVEKAQEAEKQRKKAENATQIAELRADAAIAQERLSTKPVNGLILAIKATGNLLTLKSKKKSINELKLVEREIEESLKKAVEKAREQNLLQLFPNSLGLFVVVNQNKKFILSAESKGVISSVNLQDKKNEPPFTFTCNNPNSSSENGENLKPENRENLKAVAISQDGEWMVSGDTNGIIWLCNFSNKSQPKIMPIPIQGETTIRALSISQDGQWFVSGDEKGMLTLWDKTGKQIGESIKAHDKAVISVAIFTDGKDIKIVSGGDDKKIKLWNWINNQPPTQPQFEKQLNGNVYAVAFNSDGNRIVSGSGDGVVRVWDLQKGEVIFQSPATNFILIRSVAFSPDQQILASGNSKGIIQLWKPNPQGTKVLEPYLNELRGHSGNVYSLAFINQESLISSGGDATVRVWDIKNNPSDNANLKDWLDNACKRLQYHSTFNDPSKESKVARETCTRLKSAGG